MKTEQYQAVTDRIVAMMEAGTAPWRRSWSAAGHGQMPLVRPLRVTGEPYTGANVLNLWAAAAVRGFSSRHWLTFKGAQSVGGRVRKGAKAELAFYVGQTTVTRQDKNGDDQEQPLSFLKAYCVFNADECEGLPERFQGTPVAPAPVDCGRIPSVDRFFGNTGALLAHGGDRAFYAPSSDAIRMPHIGQFNAPESYYATLLHELTHWTSPEKRCDRQLGKRFGDDAYAAEELVAELGAAFLCADLSLSAEPRADHASYLANWLGMLKADNRAIFRAASLAESAAKYLHNLQSAEAFAMAA